MSDSRTVSLFRNGRNQAVRIPVDFELPGEEAVMRREGNKLILEPKSTRSDLLDYLRSREPLGLEDDFPDIDNDHLPMREPDL
jgi:antitoxin VapB